jgi:hypothetical protein
MRSADKFSGSNYRRARGRRENRANTQSGWQVALGLSAWALAADLRITSLYPSPALRSRCIVARVALVNPQGHALVAAVVGSSLASAERRGVGARAWGSLSSLDGFGQRAPSTTPTAAVPGVVLCVADGIIRIVVRAGDDSGGRPRREIDPSIGGRPSHAPSPGVGDLIEQRTLSFNSMRHQE